MNYRSTWALLMITLAGCGSKSDADTDGTEAGSSGSETPDPGTSEGSGTSGTSADGDCGGLTCNAHEFCDWAGNSCNGEGCFEPDLTKCAARPTDCDDVWEPVCGCDGSVYASMCAASAAGVDVVDENPTCTPEPNRPPPDADCDPPEGYFRCAFKFCDISTTYCRETSMDYGPADREVTCHPLPESCGDTPSCDCLADLDCIWEEDCTVLPGGGIRYFCGEWGAAS